MAEQRESWLNQGKRSSAFASVLKIVAGQRVVVRLLDQTPAEEIWKHTARSPSGMFVKVLCTNTYEDKARCPLCLVNGNEKYKEIANRDRPYPISSENAKAVWVYEENKAKLLVGSDVWKRIDMVYQDNGDIFGCDLSISRSGAESNRVVYNVRALESSTFSQEYDPESIPKIADYLQFLRDNVKKIHVIEPGDPIPQAPEKKNETPSVLGGSRSETPAQAPKEKTAEQPSGGGDKAEREKLMTRFQDLLNKTSFNSTAMIKGVEEANKKRLAANSSAQKASDIESLSNAEFKDFIDFYEKETKGGRAG